MMKRFHTKRISFFIVPFLHNLPQECHRLEIVGGIHFFREKGEAMAEKTNIYCPCCGRKVATWDNKSQIDIAVNCRQCYKRVIYRVASGQTEIKDIPPRAYSSGKTF